MCCTSARFAHIAKMHATSVVQKSVISRAYVVYFIVGHSIRFEPAGTRHLDHHARSVFVGYKAECNEQMFVLESIVITSRE